LPAPVSERVKRFVLFVLENHKDPIRQRLESEGFDLRTLESTRQLVWCDAQDLLATFMFEGILDEYLFKTTIGGLIERAKVGDGNRRRPVRVFGEMVQITWEANLRGTERLEELWNQVIEAHAVPLLCAYSLAGTGAPAIPQSILACHSHAIA
jgi:MEDS: MEthanogen/methylotroph, DcmR Sensory domain